MAGKRSGNKALDETLKIGETLRRDARQLSYLTLAQEIQARPLNTEQQIQLLARIGQDLLAGRMTAAEGKRLTKLIGQK